MRTLPLRAEPHPLAPRLARHVGARAGCDLDVLVRVPRARADPRPLRARRRLPHAHALLPGRRARRGHPARLLSRGAQVLRLDAEGDRRLRDAADAQQDLARAHRGARPALGRRRDRARPVGPGAARARASTGTCARSSRTSPTTRSTSACPVYPEGDVYARYRVHMEEMRESVRIVEQCLDRLESMEGEPWIADDRKVVLPPRDELHTSMESLIHHFKIVTEGFRVPEGEVYVAIESPRGELGCYVVLRRRPEAVARQVPRAVVRRARGDGDVHDRRADRRHDRDRRLARHRDGRGRPVSARSYDAIQDGAREVPGGLASRAVLPALRLAQERARLALARRAPRGRRRARRDAGLLQVGRVVLRPVPPRAGRRAPRRGVHERLVRASSARSRCSRRSRRSSAAAPARRARTAR